jgi:uncharacterized membrane protein
MTHEKKNKLLLGLAIAGIAVSLYLVYAKVTSNPLVCGFGNCEKVQNSPYAIFLGIPLSYWGTLYYLSFLFVIYKKLTKFISLWSIWGILFSLYLLFIELFLIKDICMWCTFSLGIIILINILNFFVKDKLPTQNEVTK